MELLDGEYQIEQLLGKTGWARYIERSTSVRSGLVAVKVIHPQLSSHHEFVARYQPRSRSGHRFENDGFRP